MRMKDFNDKTVVITGGATGIGFGLAKNLGSAGRKLSFVNRDRTGSMKPSRS